MVARCAAEGIAAFLLVVSLGISGVRAEVSPSAGAAGAVQGAAELPVRGLHVSWRPGTDEKLCERFIREALPREGVNVLVLEVDYNYAYRSYPQVAGSNPLTRDVLQRIAQACRDAGVELVPQINCLGHQSWHQHKGGLLRAFPQFDETPWIPDSSSDFYCRSYCPLHPDVHKVVFALMDELAGDCGARNFHVGMDEVFFIAEKKCPRCGGKDPADVFAYEVNTLHDHLASTGRTMWMWGDRLIPADRFDTGKWQGSANGTWPAVDKVPKDIIICDWHYRNAPPTPKYFVEKGFRVVACPWRNHEVALAQLRMIRELRRESDRALGMLQTTWCGFEPFVRAYYGMEQRGRANRSAVEAARCFKILFAAIRGEQVGAGAETQESQSREG